MPVIIMLSSSKTHGIGDVSPNSSSPASDCNFANFKTPVSSMLSANDWVKPYFFRV